MIKNFLKIDESIILGNREAVAAMEKKEMKIFREPEDDSAPKLSKEELGVIYGPALLHCTKEGVKHLISGIVGYSHDDLFSAARGQMLDVPVSDDEYNFFGFLTTTGLFINRRKAVECVKYATELSPGIRMPTINDSSDTPVYNIYSYHLKGVAWNNLIKNQLGII